MSKKKPSKTKSKTSSIKQRNRLRNKGKIKTKKHPNKMQLLTQLPQKTALASTASPTSENDTITDDIVDMVEADDIEYLRTSISQQKYGILKQIRIKCPTSKKDKKRSVDEEDTIETKYESSQSIYERDYNTKMLLPIKTKDGIQRRYSEVVEKQNINDNEEKEKETNKETEVPRDDEVSWLGNIFDGSNINITEPVSMAKIYAKRDETIQKHKFRIGLLSSSLLENPEVKIGNLFKLLEIMDKRDPDLQITIKKIVTISLMEIFKDLLPTYQIKHQDIAFRKLKKVTQQLVGYEGQLLKGYKDFLIKLEHMANYLCRKKGDNRVISKHQKGLGLLAVKCLCDLLISHPYFNYSDNIVHLLTIYLDNPDENVRKVVQQCYKQIFHEDKRGLVALCIVRRINHLVKTRAHCIHVEALAVLLSLRIKNVNLDQEKEDEIKSKRFMTRRQKLLTLSKRERKRKKDLEKLEKEMLETKAEENKTSKEKHLTEIMKIVFLIYFRILKTAPRSNLLSVTLEGLTKFAHCINLEYYQDIVNVLDHLLDHEPLNVRERLYCIKTVFIILSGQGDALNIDPVYFYSHLYRVMLSIHAGKSHESADLLLSTLETVLVHKRKKITTQRLLSFTKRLATIALQLLHNGSLGSLCILKQTIQLNSAVDLLLDIDSSFGQGIYDPELDEPEYSNAGNTALWELCALKRSYHPIVRTLSSHILNGAPATGEGSLPADLAKLNCASFYTQYDPSQVAFRPAIHPPKRLKSKAKTNRLYNNDFINSCNDKLEHVPNITTFSTLLDE